MNDRKGVRSTPPRTQHGHTATLAPDDFRAGLVTAYVTARGDRQTERRLYAEATRYDEAHPGEPSLHDELHAIEMFGARYGEAA
jgi:hypothetical protein